MNRTAQQQNADDRLHEAIANYLKVYEYEDNDGLLVSYVVVAESVKMGDEKHSDMETQNIITKPNERLSTATGLLHIGLDIICSDEDG